MGQRLNLLFFSCGVRANEQTLAGLVSYPYPSSNVSAALGVYGRILAQTASLLSALTKPVAYLFFSYSDEKFAGRSAPCFLRIVCPYLIQGRGSRATVSHTRRIRWQRPFQTALPPNRSERRFLFCRSDSSTMPMKESSGQQSNIFRTISSFCSVTDKTQKTASTIFHAVALG